MEYDQNDPRWPRCYRILLTHIFETTVATCCYCYGHKVTLVASEVPVRTAPLKMHLHGSQVPSTAPAPAHQQYIEKNHHWHFLDTHSPPNAKTIGEQSPLKWLHQISCGSKISKMIRGTLSHLSFQHTSIPQNGTCDPVGPFDCSYSLSKPQFVNNRHSALESLDPDLFFR